MSSDKIVTIQDLAPFLVALLRGLYLAVIGAVSGVLAVLQANHAAGAHDIVIGAVIGGCLGFLGRAAEGIPDTARARVVDINRPVSDALGPPPPKPVSKWGPPAD